MSASAFAALTPDEQRAREPRTVTRGDGVEGTQLHARLDERLLDHLGDELDVGPAGDLGDDAAEARMEIDLARHHRRAHHAAVFDDRGGGLVARRLDPEDAHQARRSSTTVSPGSPRSMESSSSVYSGRSTSCAHITSASSLTSW